MFRILTSAALSMDLESTPTGVEPVSDTIVWYGHRVTVERRKCLVLMEQATRYGLFWAGMPSPSSGAWAGGEFDPEHFDPAEVNDDLAREFTQPGASMQETPPNDIV